MNIGGGIKIGNGITIVNDYVPMIVTTNLVANYDAATGVSGSTFLDSSPNAYNATIYNSPSTTTVNGTTVLQLSSASSQYFGYTGGYGTTLNNGFTFDVWCRNLSASTAGTLIAEWSNGTWNSGWTDAQMGFIAGSINAGVYNLGGTIAQSGWSSSTWYNIVMTYDLATVRTYVNGAAGGTIAGTKSNPPGTTPYATYLSMGRPDATGGGNGGSYIGGVANYFNGYIGAWKIYSAALTPTQVTQNFTALRSRYGI